MLTFIWLVLLCVVAVPWGSQVATRFPGLEGATHPTHTTHTYHICHTKTTCYNGSHWSKTSLYSFATSLGEPSHSLVTSVCMLALLFENMPDPAEDEGARASNIQLVIKYPSFSWEGNQYENFRTFKIGPPSSWRGPTRMYKKWTRLQLY